MINVAHVTNPFEPSKNLKLFTSSCNTIQEIVDVNNIPVNETPYIVIVNNKKEKPWMRKDWKKPLPKNATVTFMPVVQGSVFVMLITIVLTIVSIAISLSLSVPNPGATTTAEADPVYSLSGQTNKIKLNESIESGYGTTINWPSYAAKPYTLYIDNEAYQYSLFCIGHGEYDISQVRIEDTPIDDFQDVEYAIYGPNDDVNLFRDNVQTSSEVNAIDLYAPNEDEYDGPFEAVANDANTTTDRIQVDLVFPKGLYRQNDSGGLMLRTVEADIEYMEIDNDGNEIGSWTLLQTFSKTLRTTTPQRFTVSSDIPVGRYKIRVGRTNNANLVNPQFFGEDIQWESLKAFLPNVGNYGDVTVLAVKARATANLNNQSSRKFNVKQTRKLPIWDNVSKTWSAPTATRSIVWAFCDVFRSVYGANLSDDILDLETLYDIDQQLSNYTHPRYFDWVFDKQTTCWEAARTICRAGRATPIFNGSQVFMVVDGPQTIHRQLFNRENIVKDSLEEDISLYVQEEYDSIEIEYTDIQTGKNETVLCALPNSFGERPDRVILAGVTDRNRAFEEGMVIVSQKKYQRGQLKFKTGMEGLLSTFGDLIKVMDDSFGLDGVSEGFLVSVAEDDVTVVLSDKVVFEDGYDYAIIVNGKDGTPYGPYTVTEGSHARQVVLDSGTMTDQLSFSDHGEPPRYIFGRTIELAKDCVITAISPQDEEIVEITAIEYSQEVYAYDGEDAPELNNPNIGVPDVGLPTVTGVSLVLKTDDLYEIRWNPALGAQYYIVQVSGDDLELNDPEKNWYTIGQTTSTSFETVLQTERAYVRVSGVNIGQGPWAYYEELIDGSVIIDHLGNELIDHDGNTIISHAP